MGLNILFEFIKKKKNKSFQREEELRQISRICKKHSESKKETVDNITDSYGFGLHRGIPTSTLTHSYPYIPRKSYKVTGTGTTSKVSITQEDLDYYRRISDLMDLETKKQYIKQASTVAKYKKE